MTRIRWSKCTEIERRFSLRRAKIHKSVDHGEEVRRKYRKDELAKGKKYFSGHDELTYARKLRSEQQFDRLRFS